MGLFDNPASPPERVPVPLILDDWNAESMTYAIEMRLPVQVTLLDNFDAMVHDECLWNAHRRGLMPVGQILVTTRPDDAPKPRPKEALEEGKPMIPDVISKREQEMRDRVRANNEATAKMLGFDPAALGGGAVSPVQDQCIVRAEVFIGTAL